MESLDNVRFQDKRFNTKLLMLDKRITKGLNVMWRRMDRHCDELERLKDTVQELEGQLLELESEKVVLELGMKCLSKQLCRCSGTSTHMPGNGSLEFPYKVSDSSDNVAVCEDCDVVVEQVWYNTIYHMIL